MYNGDTPVSKIYEQLSRAGEERLRIQNQISAYAASENRSPHLTARLSAPPADENATSGFLKPLRIAGLSLSVVLCLSASFFLGHSLLLTRNNHKIKETTAEAKLPELSSPTSTTHSFNPKAPPGVPDFVLQVGAMKNEENAVSLTNLLRQKNFPVYVIKSADSLYRVFVGPYSDVKSSASSEAELKSQGFETIRKRNRPAQ
jgi:hypothetical protein